mmetsp:Transcript_53071/g.88123  ORF Transcript_53071/g.88123 Transcript_53071/m.88123 type:complete len:359 (-) Transcript_53071:115-1191(-)
MRTSKLCLIPLGCSARWRFFGAFASGFEERVARFWTAERLHALCTKHAELPLAPNKPGVAPLLRIMGLMGADARISHDSLRKFQQVNAVFLAVERALETALQRRTKRPLRLLEMCAGKSYLAILLAFASEHRWRRPCHIIAVDRCSKRTAASTEKAMLLGLGHSICFRHVELRHLGEWPEEYRKAFPELKRDGLLGDGWQGKDKERPRPPHCALALHACDVAADEALSQAVRARAELVVIAPCCQAELGNKWARLAAEGASSHPFSLIHRTSSLRQETAAHITDAMRIALLRASGYSVTATEFVPGTCTPKNRLVVGSKLTSAEHAARARSMALRELASLKNATGGQSILLEDLLALD